jgi:uridine phosphorylase
VVQFPILEFDSDRAALLEPYRDPGQAEVPPHCVPCFFSDVVRKVTAEHNAKVVVDNRWEDGPHRLYEIERNGRRLAYYSPGLGSAAAAGLLEEAIAFGCSRFVACGGCGVLDRTIGLGQLVCVSAAVRDEGASYHYLPPSREVEANPVVLSALGAILKARGIPFVSAKTWTTDAPYRETRGLISRRKAEGCLVVEMEAAGMMAVAHFRNVAFGQVLYGGDDLSGTEWDNRDWQSKSEVRENLFWLCADAVLSLP